MGCSIANLVPWRTAMAVGAGPAVSAKPTKTTKTT
jgi:hypothetical protein